MILAAGRGERMRPLTDVTPKPLLCAGGKPLIAWHLERLAAAGFDDVVINHAWLGGQIENTLGDGRQWGLKIAYSPEAPEGLETAGGIATALPLLGPEPFLVVNGDIWCDWDPAAAPALAGRLRQDNATAWVLLTANPPHHPEGDFCLDLPSENRGQTTVNPAATAAAKPGSDPGLCWVSDRPCGGGRGWTFTGIGIYEPRLFDAVAPGTRAPLAPLLRQAMAGQKVLGQVHAGRWIDVGTPQRLQELDEELRG